MRIEQPRALDMPTAAPDERGRRCDGASSRRPPIADVEPPRFGLQSKTGFREGWAGEGHAETRLSGGG